MGQTEIWCSLPLSDQQHFRSGVPATPGIESEDIGAASHLNRLYLEIRKDNSDWTDRQQDMNRFMARLIFCFFAGAAGIFPARQGLSGLVNRLGRDDSSDSHLIIAELFQLLGTPKHQRERQTLNGLAAEFPFIGNGLFTGNHDVPRIGITARGLLAEIDRLDWTRINPDIFGSMIQTITGDDERDALGMHYTSTPNILKVLNPLFLDDLRKALAEAGEDQVRLLRLRDRIARIRLFDPACGSGNFLVIAYKQLRGIEAAINRGLGLPACRSALRITNFHGIELREFPAEIARLALMIAEMQCDLLYGGPLTSEAVFTPIRRENWIVCGNALQMDWCDICPPPDTAGEDQPPLTVICGNPPYKGSKWQTPQQKADLARAWAKAPHLARATDYVTGWLAGFMDYVERVPTAIAAFVTTNSICQGQQASEIWPVLFRQDIEISFAHTPFKWSNLASNNAGVTVIIIGLATRSVRPKLLFDDKGQVRPCAVIGPYLVPDRTCFVKKTIQPIGPQSPMLFGNMPRDGGHLFLTPDEAATLSADPATARFVRPFVGSEELINGKRRHCLWIGEKDAQAAAAHPLIAERLALVADNRSKSRAPSTRDFARRPHRFVQIAGWAKSQSIAVPRVSSENRDYLPVDVLGPEYIIGDRNFALYDAPLWNMALITSRLHWVWIGTVCVRLEMRFSYSNTLGWNSFPVPRLSQRNRDDLTACARDILLARRAHAPATIAELYDPATMPPLLRQAHDRNDAVLERIYIGRRFRDDAERLEKLFDLYAVMTAGTDRPPQSIKSSTSRTRLLAIR